MPPKAADKKPASASKAPATASKAPEKKDAGKKTAASGDKKKRTKTRKETYSSYIYKGEFLKPSMLGFWARWPRFPGTVLKRNASLTSIDPYSPQASPPRYWYL